MKPTRGATMRGANLVNVPAEGFMDEPWPTIGHDLMEMETRGVISHEPGGAVEGYQIRLLIRQRASADAPEATIWTPWLFAPREVVKAMAAHLRDALRTRPTLPGTSQ